NAGGGVSVALCSNDRQAVAACNDGTARLWNLPDAETLLLPFANAGEQQRKQASRLGVPLEQTNSLGMKLMLILPGMLKANTGTQVHITKPYYLGAHEVTVGQFRAFVKATNYHTVAETHGTRGMLYIDRV